MISIIMKETTIISISVPLSGSVSYDAFLILRSITISLVYLVGACHAHASTESTTFQLVYVATRDACTALQCHTIWGNQASVCVISFPTLMTLTS